VNGIRHPSCQKKRNQKKEPVSQTNPGMQSQRQKFRAVELQRPTFLRIRNNGSIQMLAVTASPAQTALKDSHLTRRLPGAPVAGVMIWSVG